MIFQWMYCFPLNRPQVEKVNANWIPYKPLQPLFNLPVDWRYLTRSCWKTPDSSGDLDLFKRGMVVILNFQGMRKVLLPVVVSSCRWGCIDIVVLTGWFHGKATELQMREDAGVQGYGKSEFCLLWCEKIWKLLSVLKCVGWCLV